jgi:hypothetical protein
MYLQWNHTQVVLYVSMLHHSIRPTRSDYPERLGFELRGDASCCMLKVTKGSKAVIFDLRNYLGLQTSNGSDLFGKVCNSG